MWKCRSRAVWLSSGREEGNRKLLFIYTVLTVCPLSRGEFRPSVNFNNNVFGSYKTFWWSQRVHWPIYTIIIFWLFETVSCSLASTVKMLRGLWKSPLRAFSFFCYNLLRQTAGPTAGTLMAIPLFILSASPGGRFKNTYELLNLRALKISKLHKNHIFQCMGKIFCVEFQRVPLKFHTKYLTHTLKDVDFIHI